MITYKSCVLNSLCKQFHSSKSKQTNILIDGSISNIDLKNQKLKRDGAHQNPMKKGPATKTCIVRRQRFMQHRGSCSKDNQFELELQLWLCKVKLLFIKTFTSGWKPALCYIVVHPLCLLHPACLCLQTMDVKSIEILIG